MADATTIQKQLAAPFKPQQLGWKPQVTTKDGAKCLAVPYVDARDVMGRLNDVLGLEGWSDEYEVLRDGCVVCKLTISTADGTTTRSDAGGPSDQPDVGDKLKAAFSDAFKRAAVKFGVGRYLYYLPPIWVGIDQYKKPDEAAAIAMLPKWARPDDSEKKAA